MAASLNAETRQFELEEESEFRFEVDFNEEAHIKLLKGTAEIFGTELVVGVEYTFSAHKAAIYTWHGCLLEVRGKVSVEYTANETPMTSYFNAHMALQTLRSEAEKRGDIGPRVLVIGPHDVGKTSLCKILASYALRQDETPLFISLDPSEGSVTMPGTVTATSIQHILDVEEGFGTSATTTDASRTPLAYYYGYENTAEKVALYKRVVSQLARSVTRRIAQDKDSRRSGCIIDTDGSIDKVFGYDLIQHTIDAFSVNVILVVGHERLYSEMSRILKDRPEITIVPLKKSGGVVERDPDFRSRLWKKKIHEYFHGTTKPKGEVSSHRIFLNFDDIQVWMAGETVTLSSALPLGMDSSDNESRLIKVENYEVCFHSILAILHGEPQESSDGLLERSIKGFIYVSEVNEEKRKLTALSTVPLTHGSWNHGPLFMGNFKWLDD